MPYALYVCLQDEDKIVAFTMDATTGQLTPTAAVPVAGGPSVLAISPDRHVLYVGHRGQPALSSFRIDHATGGLTPQGTVASPHVASPSTETSTEVIAPQPDHARPRSVHGPTVTTRRRV